ncbi:MAG: hypothetical protein LBO72_06720 [Helicobacteraceae bacterium]|jgi:hypothetical protein|nr:hypothetical protein [Helicobacteraceae bacterium]
MILAYEFIYVSKNALLENFLYAIAAEAKREFYIVKANEKITLFVKGEEEELRAFSDLLAAEAPLSIFLRSVNVKVAKQWEIEKASAIAPCETPIGFTPKTQALSAQSGDWTIAPEIGKRIALNNMPPIDEAFARLRNGESVAIEGKYTIAPLTDRFCDESAVVMPTDIGFIASVVVANEEDISALGSLERPILRLPTNIIFSAKYPTAPRIISVALAGDLYLYLLSIKLAKSGVKAIALNGYDRLRVVALKDRNLVISGAGLSQNAARFLAIKEPHFRAFAAAIDERGLQSESNLGFFFSLYNDDYVVFNNPESGAIELLKVDFPSSIDEVFLAIEQRDQNGAKLIASYRAQYGEIAKSINAVSLKNAPKNIASLWGIIGLILGVSDNLNNSCEKMFEHIAFGGALKAPSADYKLTANSIDFIALTRGAISYKLAGAPNELIAYGLCEGLARFLGDLCDLIAAGSSADAMLREVRNADKFISALNVETPKNIFLIGSLFSRKIFSQLTLNAISPNKPPLFPNELPLEL